jgi:hypothetical protein
MFRVRWNRTARDALTTLWLAADSAGRAELTRTTNLIDGLWPRPLQRLENRGRMAGGSCSSGDSTSSTGWRPMV